MRLSDSCRQEAEGEVGSEHGSRQVGVVIILAKEGKRTDKAKQLKQDHLGMNLAPMFNHSFQINRSSRSIDH